MQAALDAGEATFLFSVEQDKTLPKKPPATTLPLVLESDASYAQQYLPYKLPQRLFNCQQSKMQGNVNQFGLLQRFGPDTNEQRYSLHSYSLMFHRRRWIHPQWQRL